jgi:carbon-monoxide dehydrogenase medium subunit
MIVTGAQGERTVPAEAFYTGLFQTALSPEEVLIAVDVPARRAEERCAFVELARRSGDYALVGLASQARVKEGELSDVRLAYFAVGAVPKLATKTAAHLTGQPITDAALANAQAALAGDLDPHDDLQASAATRLHLARVLLRRALGELLPESVGREPERRRA